MASVQNTVGKTGVRHRMRDPVDIPNFSTWQRFWSGCAGDVLESRGTILPVRAPAEGSLGRVGMFPVRPRERDTDGPAFLGGGSCPSVPNDPAHEGAPGHGVHSLPACAVPEGAYGGEVGE